MKDIAKCDHTMIGIYYDKELDQSDAARFEDHLKRCESCRSELKAYRSVSSVIHRGIGKESFPDLEQRIIERSRKKESFIFGRASWLIPATVMAMMILFFSHMYITPIRSGPSAIVSYVSGDLSSVMIMETPKTRQTILWIQENF